MINLRREVCSKNRAVFLILEDVQSGEMGGLILGKDASVWFVKLFVIIGSSGLLGVDVSVFPNESQDHSKAEANEHILDEEIGVNFDVMGLGQGGNVPANGASHKDDVLISEGHRSGAEPRVRTFDLVGIEGFLPVLAGASTGDLGELRTGRRHIGIDNLFQLRIFDFGRGWDD